MTNVVPFPKPEKARRLPKHAWKKLRDRVCADGGCVGCERYFGPASARLSAHHVLERSLGGDDVFENLVPLCGDGTIGCHGAITSGNPSLGLDGVMRDPDAVRARVRRHVADRHGHLLYLIRKRGSSDAARAFLDRYYPERPTRDEGGHDHAA